MTEQADFFYDNLICPECSGHQKNCEHYWAGRSDERKQILKRLTVHLLTPNGVGELMLTTPEIIALIKGEK